MKIVYEHSHLNGKEYLQVHFPSELQEIIDVVTKVNGNVWKKSNEKAKNRKAQKSELPYAIVYNQIAINLDFKDKFRELGWNEKKFKYYATTDEHTARDIMTLPAKEAKTIKERYSIFSGRGGTPLLFRYGFLALNHKRQPYGNCNR
ncbi:MAG: hypothetical protein FWG42_06715 [Clostridiales bacterium]|nr:hypothetical protein [Clostridiales bacterium]